MVFVHQFGFWHHRQVWKSFWVWHLHFCLFFRFFINGMYRSFEYGIWYHRQVKRYFGVCHLYLSMISGITGRLRVVLGLDFCNWEWSISITGLNKRELWHLSHIFFNSKFRFDLCFTTCTQPTNHFHRGNCLLYAPNTITCIWKNEIN